MEPSLDCPYGLTLITETVRNRCHPHTVTHKRSQQMPPSHPPEASTDATLTPTRGLNKCYPELTRGLKRCHLTFTRGLNRCHPHTHKRPQQMPPSHPPEISTDATFTPTRGLNRCHPHTHQRPQQMPPSHPPQASTDATLTLTRGLNRCHTHIHQRPQQMLHSHSQETTFTGGFLQKRPP